MKTSKTLNSLLLGSLVLAAVTLPARGDFFEDFSSGWDTRWTHSSESKYNGKFIVETPEGLEGAALKVPEKARHYGIAAQLEKPLKVADDGLVLQFELKLSEGLTCGGAYIKYLTSGEFEASGLKDDTPYTVMFGPDKCGSTNKVHLILRHKSPSGKVEEKHLKSPPLVNLDKKTHVYTAVLNPNDNTYEVLIDGESKKSGSLFEDFTPTINPAEEIDDPEDKKPADWIENPKMADPEAKKPEDWDEDAPRTIEDPDAEQPEDWQTDEPAEVDDPEASQPEDWDEEEDGEWESPKVSNPKCDKAGCGVWKRPTIPNPDYKGKWSADLIDNPAYKGTWAPKKIANPDYFVDETPLKNLGHIGGLAIEIWTMDDGYYFSNIFVGTDADKASAYRDSHWAAKADVEGKQAEEEAAKLKEEQDKAADSTDTGGNWLSDTVLDLFDHPPLDKLKPGLAPLLDALEDRPNFIYVVLGTLVLLPLAVFRRIRSKTRKPASATLKQPTTKQAKKADVTGPDDSVADNAAGAVRTAQTNVVDAVPSTSEAAGDDEELETVKPRRPRRDA